MNMIKKSQQTIALLSSMVNGGEKHSEQSEKAVDESLEALKKVEDLLGRSSAELKTLRRSNEIMAAKLSVFHDMMYVIRTSPPSLGTTNGMGEDVAWQIDQFLLSDKH